MKHDDETGTAVRHSPDETVAIDDTPHAAGATLHTIRVGNTEARKGHRRDCAQAVVELDVLATSRDEAIGKVRELVVAHKVAGDGALSCSLPGVTLRVYLNVDNIRVEDVGT